MKEFARTTKRVVVTATIGLAIAAATIGPAAAGTDGVISVPKGGYKTLSQCQLGAKNLFPGSGADSWYCQSTGQSYILYFLYHT
jgi:hypothetical protein